MAIKTETGLELEPYQVVFKPLVTEKNTHLAERDNVYAFKVHPQATKTNIREAVQALWDVRVTKVRTQNRKGKPRRTRTGYTQTQNWKKAIVELHEEDRINFF
ncbi:50S ribosomal protein L23 [bacterium]|uniref:Large ribosomal subunit protein uL23 n=1 Tax=Rubinisphaera brasiliensis (strain ATCC 49424 / DSM 5305 / JCM 21570 / IAM 15109 / NBRC 103401 / IFAM 1448) TaxID=756272 RepID=F0SJ88_RUBBR|nr:MULTISPECIES: 50S ribosomal protein L23 [Rubinisphaera]ADY59663.1 LSU ribosomal protein L23P [Rubinisphaera brasiliensis DSM 5305]MBB02879.1 50S ribosomal protein L23 [Planctomyces sp.]MBR9803277.1 50S ribosomal protein L23 [bacterium]